MESRRSTVSSIPEQPSSKKEYSEKLTGLNLERKIEGLTELLRDDDGMAESFKVPGGYELHIYNCVLSRVVSLFPQACKEEMEMIERLLGAKVERTEHMTSGSRRCVYFIREPEYGTSD